MFICDLTCKMNTHIGSIDYGFLLCAKTHLHARCGPTLVFSLALDQHTYIYKLHGWLISYFWLQAFWIGHSIFVDIIVEHLEIPQHLYSAPTLGFRFGNQAAKINLYFVAIQTHMMKWSYGGYRNTVRNCRIGSGVRFIW